MQCSSHWSLVIITKYMKQSTMICSTFFARKALRHFFSWTPPSGEVDLNLVAGWPALQAASILQSIEDARQQNSPQHKAAAVGLDLFSGTSFDTAAHSAPAPAAATPAKPKATAAAAKPAGHGIPGRFWRGVPRRHSKMAF